MHISNWILFVQTSINLLTLSFAIQISVGGYLLAASHRLAWHLFNDGTNFRTNSYDYIISFYVPLRAARPSTQWLLQIRARFLSLARSKLRLCSANHRPGYWSNLPCDWPSTAWAYSEQETENGPRSVFNLCHCTTIYNIVLHNEALYRWPCSI